MNDAILLAAIMLMVYGIVQHFRLGDEFWFSPAGNVIGAIAVAVVAGACFDLALQDEFVVLVAVLLGLYWFSSRKKNKKPATKQSFEQIFETVEVEPIVEPDPIVEQFVEDESIVEATPEASPVFMWKGA